MIVDLSSLKYIDIDGIETLKFINKLAKTKRVGFVRMSGNEVFDKSEFVKQAEFYENFETAVQKTKENGPVENDMATAEGGDYDDEYRKL